MLKNVLTGTIVMACAASMVLAQGGQGGGRGRGAQEAFPTPQQFTSSKQTQQHIATAMKMAQSDLVADAKAFCTPTGPQRPALARQAAGLAPEPDRLVEPIRMFENLYYVGFSDVGAWVIPTSDGIIVFEALNNGDEDPDILVNKLPAMEALGQYPTGAHPFLYGSARFGRYLDIMLECGRARLAALESASS